MSTHEKETFIQTYQWAKDWSQLPEDESVHCFAKYALMKILGWQRETCRRFGLRFETWYFESELHETKRRRLLELRMDQPLSSTRQQLEPLLRAADSTEALLLGLGAREVEQRGPRVYRGHWSGSGYYGR